VDGGWVGILTVDLHLPDARSLKTKRREVQRVKQGLARPVAAAAAEVAHHELWQRARLSFAVVGRTAADVEDRLEETSRRLHSDEAFLVSEEGRLVQAIETEPDYLRP